MECEKKSWPRDGNGIVGHWNHNWKREKWK